MGSPGRTSPGTLARRPDGCVFIPVNLTGTPGIKGSHRQQSTSIATCRKYLS